MDVFSNLLGPLEKKNCTYFAFLCIFSFLMGILALFTVIMKFFKMGLKELLSSPINVFISVSTVLLYALMYLQNRLLYQMCIKTI